VACLSRPEQIDPLEQCVDRKREREREQDGYGRVEQTFDLEHSPELLAGHSHSLKKSELSFSGDDAGQDRIDEVQYCDNAYDGTQESAYVFDGTDELVEVFSDSLDAAVIEVRRTARQFLEIAFCICSCLSTCGIGTEAHDVHVSSCEVFDLLLIEEELLGISSESEHGVEGCRIVFSYGASGSSPY